MQRLYELVTLSMTADENFAFCSAWTPWKGEEFEISTMGCVHRRSEFDEQSLINNETRHIVFCLPLCIVFATKFRRRLAQEHCLCNFFRFVNADAFRSNVLLESKVVPKPEVRRKSKVWPNSKVMLKESVVSSESARSLLT